MSEAAESPACAEPIAGALHCEALADWFGCVMSDVACGACREALHSQLPLPGRLPSPWHTVHRLQETCRRASKAQRSFCDFSGVRGALMSLSASRSSSRRPAALAARSASRPTLHTDLLISACLRLKHFIAGLSLRSRTPNSSGTCGDAYGVRSDNRK